MVRETRAPLFLGRFSGDTTPIDPPLTFSLKYCIMQFICPRLVHGYLQVGIWTMPIKQNWRHETPRLRPQTDAARDIERAE